VTREPNFDELVDAETTGPERERLRNVHELLLRAGPPAELTPGLESGPDLDAAFSRRRDKVKTRAMVLLAAAITVALVFIGGYAAGGGGSGSGGNTVATLSLKGTSAAPRARASLEVWKPRDGNWPMTLTAVGLKKLPPRRYYEVYVVRQGVILGSCGVFRVKGPHRAAVVTLNAPYPLQKGDTWVVTRQGTDGSEPGTTVLQPVNA
jgi:Anti-sigma-K factor rskA